MYFLYIFMPNQRDLQEKIILLFYIKGLQTKQEIQSSLRKQFHQKDILTNTNILLNNGIIEVQYTEKISNSRYYLVYDKCKQVKSFLSKILL